MRRRDIGVGARLGMLALTGLSVICMTSWFSCFPVPVNPGFISTAPGRPGGVDLAINAGGGKEFWNFDEEASGGGGTLHVEPYATPRLSVPLSLTGGGSKHEHLRAGGGAGRAGLRYRVLSWLSIGTGATAGVFKGEEDWIAGYHINEHEKWAAFLDLELTAGHRWGFFAFAITMRPSFELVEEYFMLPIEGVIAFFPSRAIAITLHIYGGNWVHLQEDHDEGGWITGGIGFMLQLPLKKTLQHNEGA